jgi:hypothetical protein
MRSMPCWSVVLLLTLPHAILAQDVESGPAKGMAAPAVRIFDATGEHTGKSLDYAAERKEKLKVYAFVRADRCDRPVARFLRELDKVVQNEGENHAVVAVWLTDDVEKAKEYLPKAEQSLQLQATALT